MGTNRRKAIKDKFDQAVKDRRIKARRERKAAKKVANRLLGRKIRIDLADGNSKDYSYTYKFRNSQTGVTTSPKI